jgi:hypothetical protein
MPFPFFEVLSYETALPVSVVVWHVRSVRAIREPGVDDDTVTRIEFVNGDVLDTSDAVPYVLEGMRGALRPVTDYLVSRR